MTCSELAKRIKERVDDRLELRSLSDPQVREWRGRALGEEVPWAPTLIEVRGPTRVRVWTGPGMAIHLSRALGPLASWRVMQALGEMGAESASERLGERAALGALARAVSRGQFLKGAGGVVVGAAVLAGFGWVPLATNGGGRRSSAQAQAREEQVSQEEEGCSFREPAYTYGELTGSDRDTLVVNNYYNNPQFRVLYNTFSAAGFKPRPDAARVVSVTYTTSGGTTRYAYDLRLPFERVGQKSRCSRSPQTSRRRTLTSTSSRGHPRSTRCRCSPSHLLPW